MLQEIGIRSNLSLIVLTVIVVCLTILYIIESRRINRELTAIKDKLHIAYEELLKLKGKKIDEEPVKENKEIINETPEEIPEETPEEIPEEIPEETQAKKLIKESPKPIHPPISPPISNNNPLIAMMMSGPPPGMIPMSISQNIEEWDDELDQPQQLLEEETETDKTMNDEKEETYEEETSEEEGSSEEEGDSTELNEIQLSTDYVNSSYSVKQLQDICKKNDLSYSGNKTQLVERINKSLKK